MADNIVGCCSGSPCQSLANIAYINQLINIGSAGCKPGVPQAPAITDGCCVDSGDADEYVVKYGDFSSLSKRSTSENPVNDVSGYILGEPSSSNGCCPGSTAEYALNKGEVSFGYTTIESVDIQNAVFTDVCNGRVSYTKNDSWLRHERSCDSNGGVEETTTPVSYSTNVSTAITVTKSVGTCNGGSITVNYSGTINESTEGCNATKTKSEQVTSSATISFAIDYDGEEEIPCDGGDVYFSIDNNSCESITISVSGSNGAYYDEEHDTIKLVKNDAGVSTEEVSLCVNVAGVECCVTEIIKRGSCASYVAEGCSPYYMKIDFSEAGYFEIHDCGCSDIK